MIKKNTKIINCPSCGANFNNTDAFKVCSNCFACTGCETYICMECEDEVVVKPIKKPEWDSIK